jgi:eukaryotic-like serine/threonine-protein kinase
MTEEQVFLAVLDLPDQEARIAYLDEACGQNSELRHQVEELLAAHARTGQFLDQPAVEQMAAGTQPPVGQTFALDEEGGDAMADNKKANPSPRDEAAEDLQFLSPSTRPDSLGRLGHYEMPQVLGRGGFGIVFRAFDDMLQRVVAVKVMAPQIATLSPARKRFLREARSSAAVRHENVVHVYEVGEQPLPYLAMEFVPGETLQQKLDRNGPLEVSEVLRIGRQIAEGLAAAHASDLIHRDIKPSNILVAEGGASADFVKLLDFGLVRGLEEAGDRLTQTGLILGTPGYMSPQQAAGDTVLDARTDIYSIGAVAYFLLSGQPPFAEKTPWKRIVAHILESPRPLQELRPDIPDELAQIISRCLLRDAEQRFSDVGQLEQAFAACTGGADWSEGHAAAWWKARRDREQPSDAISPHDYEGVETTQERRESC